MKNSKTKSVMKVKEKKTIMKLKERIIIYQELKCMMTLAQQQQQCFIIQRKRVSIDICIIIQLLCLCLKVIGFISPFFLFLSGLQFQRHEKCHCAKSQRLYGWM